MPDRIVASFNSYRNWQLLSTVVTVYTSSGMQTLDHMKILRFVMYLFYRYFSTGRTYRIPYLSALSATGFLIFLHVFETLILMKKLNWLPMDRGNSRIVEYGDIVQCLIPIFIILTLLIKEKDLLQLEYSDDKIRSGGRNLILYVVFSVNLFIAALIGFV